MKQEIQERINGHIEYLKKNDSDVEIYVEPKDNVRTMKQALDDYWYLYSGNCRIYR